MADDSPAAFGRFVGSLPGPALIVTAAEGAVRQGCLVGFATQASIDPPRLLVCLSVANATFDVAVRAGRLGVHVVPADRPDLAELFGGETGDEVDKFAQVAWREGDGGEPLLVECGTRLSGRTLTRVAFGDHVGFLLEPVTVWAAPSGQGLDIRRAARIDPGHAP
jgi:flavin reductase (DIM6/NTAB) family NADH-FMN oxidoreductase RutF